MLETILMNIAINEENHVLAEEEEELRIEGGIKWTTCTYYSVPKAIDIFDNLVSSITTCFFSIGIF